MIYRASLVAQTVKRLPAVRETRVQFLGREDPLEKEMAPHSSTLAWKIQNSVVLVSAGPRGASDYTCAHTHSFRFFPNIGHYRVLGRVSRAIQKVRIRGLFHM